jgi:hypothetical protein
LLVRPLYRARQFFDALSPVVRPAELREVEAVLGPRLTPLFASMSERDQRHCLDVYEALLAAGCEDGELLTAALLHDAGKGSLAGTKVQLWHRVAYVALENAPESGLRVASERSPGIEVLRTHAERGVQLAAEFGASPEVLFLLREMDNAASADPRALMLRAADERA